MSHFAKVVNGYVEQVIVADQDVIDSGIFGHPSLWIQTSYNTHAGQHLLGGTPLRKNYAGIGHIYDAVRDAFYPPQPYPSWQFNEDSCTWIPPSACPTDGFYYWDEATLSWIEVK